MLKRFALAAVATAAFAAVPASAADVTCMAPSPAPGCNITLTPAGPNQVAGLLGFSVSGTAGAFTATFNFTNPYTPAGAAGSATFSFLGGSALTFTGGNISGGGTVTTTNTAAGSQVIINRSGLAGGAQTITFNGMFNPVQAGSVATVGGQLSLTAVPEPGTWAMFILGFGVLGFAMRRQNAKVTTAKANLRFA